MEQLERDVPAKLTRYVATALEKGEKVALRIDDINEQRELVAEYFCYSVKGRYFDFINAKILSENLKQYLEQVEFIDHIVLAERASEKVDGDDDERPPLYFNLRTEEVFRRRELVSIRFWHESYSGGAHGSHFASTLNFAGPKMVLPSIRHVLSHNEKSLEALLDFIDADLERQDRLFLEDETSNGDASAPYERTFGVRDFAGAEEDRWLLVEDFNFEDQGMLITLSPRTLIPHVLGTREVRIPWRAAVELTSEQFREAVAPLLGV